MSMKYLLKSIRNTLASRHKPRRNRTARLTRPRVEGLEDRSLPSVTVAEYAVGLTANSEPQKIATGADGNLWFTEQGANQIGRITPSGTVTEFSAGITANATLNGIAAGSDGNLWFTENNDDIDQIGRITPSGIVTEFPADLPNGSSPHDITAGPDGNLWFTASLAIGRMTPTGAVTIFPTRTVSGSITAGPDGNLWFTDGVRIGRITPSGTVTEFGSLGSVAIDLTAGPDGNLWFTEDDDVVGRITPSGTVTEFSTGTHGVELAGIATGADGNLWFDEEGDGAIGRMTPSGVATQFATGPTGTSTPIGITAGPDGNLWFTDEFSSQGIGRVTLQSPVGITGFSTGITANSEPQKIATGADGNLWFTEQGANQIGRITPSGTVTEFSAGITANATLNGIAAGSDGNLWFTENNDDIDQIGRITPSGIVTEFPADLPNGSSPHDITAGPDGNLWFTASLAIGRMTPTGAVTIFPTRTVSGSITAGPDGNLWFTDGVRIGRITPSGTVTEFGSLGSVAIDLTVGPDGNLWFTEDDDVVGRITPSGTVTEFSTGTHGVELAGIATGADGNLWFDEEGDGAIGRMTPSGVAMQFFTGPTGTSTPIGITAGPDGTVWYTDLFSSQAIGRITLLSAAAGPPVDTMAGQTFSGSLASAVVLDPDINASDLTASIDWGDGGTSAGTLAGNSLTGFSVSGSHRYTKAGHFNALVTVAYGTTPSGLEPVTAVATVAVTVSPAAADHLAFAVQPGNGLTGSALSPAVQVEVLDQFGNLLTADNSDRVTVGVASGPDGFAAGSTTTATVSGGIATFSNLVLNTPGTYALSDSATGGLTGPNSNSFQMTWPAIALAGKPQINGNLSALAGAQRSMVDDIVYTFNHAVSLSGAAFSIALHNGVTVNGNGGQSVGTLPTLNWSSADGGVTWVVTFSGNGVVGGSIADGVYDVTLNHAAVTDAQNQTLASDRTDTFSRLYGDVAGNGRVNAVDLNAFANAFGSRSGQSNYLACLDYDGNGRINIADYNAFTNNFGTRYSGFTPTI